MTTRLSAPGEFELAGLRLNVTDDEGTIWAVSSVSGWHSGASVSTEAVQRLTGPGVFPQRGRRGGRTVTLTGTVTSPDRMALGRAQDTLSALLADGDFGVFKVTDDAQGTRWANVQLAESPEVDWDIANRLEFRLALFSPDAVKYGAISTASTGFPTATAGGLVFPLFDSGVLDFGSVGSQGFATVRNDGRAPASPRFTVTGPTPAGGFEIADLRTGQTIRYLGFVPEGSSVVLDSSDGSVVLDGTGDRLNDVIVANWPTIPPRSSSDFYFSAIGDVTASILTVSASSTYW